LKIAQHLTKLEAKYSGTFFPDTVYMGPRADVIAACLQLIMLSCLLSWVSSSSALLFS